MDEISNFYNFSLRLFIFVTHIFPIINKNGRVDRVSLTLDSSLASSGPQMRIVKTYSDEMKKMQMKLCSIYSYYRGMCVSKMSILGEKL